MPRALRRETFIALRARRQAYGIAQDILNPHVDVAAVPCRACEHDVPIDPTHLGATVRCPGCGAEVLLPANYLAKIDGLDEPAPRRERAQTDDWRAFIWLVTIVAWAMLTMTLTWLAVALTAP